MCMGVLLVRKLEESRPRLVGKWRSSRWNYGICFLLSSCAMLIWCVEWAGLVGIGLVACAGMAGGYRDESVARLEGGSGV